MLCGHVAIAQIVFQDVTESAGVRQPLAGMMGHGGAWGDVDSDGDVDLYVGGFADRPDEEYLPAPGPLKNCLFLNDGNGVFTLAKMPGVQFYGRTSGAVFADLNNDGLPELYVANNCKGRTKRDSGPQHDAQLRYSNLFRNDGGMLVDISSESGACPNSLGTARNIGVFDYDQDGLLDLFVVEDRFTKNPRSVLFHNDGDLRFSDASTQVGLPDDVFGLGLAVADLNDDTRPDFFVGHSNRLFFSTRDGKYVESAAVNDVFRWDPVDGEDWPCGAHFADLNRDGRLDLVLSIHHHEPRNRVYLNEGIEDGFPVFRDVTAAVGLPAKLSNKSPHVELQDFDNDGWVDIYLSTAWLGNDGTITPLVYRNLGLHNGLPRFAAPATPSGEVVYFPAGPSADFDRDGRVDLCLINWFSGNHTRLLRNASTPERGWLQVAVRGRSFNRQGIGSQIRVYPAGQLTDEPSLLGFQELTIGYGYASGQEAVCHFGLAQHDTVDLAVRFPNGKRITRTNVAANQRIVLEE